MRTMRSIRVVSALAVLPLIAATFVACGGEAVPDEQAAVDREMDLAMDEPVAEPELADVPTEDEVERPAPPPATPPPAAAPPPSPTPPPAPPPEPEPEESPQTESEAAPAADAEASRSIQVTAAAGESFRVVLRQELSTRDNQPGDRFTAVTQDPLIGGPYVVLPAGTLVRGEVTAVQKSGGQGEPAVIKVHFYSVEHEGTAYPLVATVTDATAETEGRYSAGDKAARIGGGAAAGAIVGAILGKGKGAVIGGVVGAAAGTAITLATEDVDAVLPAGSVITLQLEEGLTIEVADPAAS